MSKKKLLLFGGSGQIGSRIIDLLSSNFQIIAPTHSKVDLANPKAVKRFINTIKPSMILHAAGFTIIDKAIEFPVDAFNANTASLFVISQEASKIKAPFYYLSTDIVFDGQQTTRPYKESDIPNPLSLNAKYKRLGELITLDADKNNGVIRLIVCFSAHFPKRLDLARLAVEKVKKGEIFKATNDQYINPIFIDDLVNAIGQIIKNKASGIYHVGATNYTTPYKFAKSVIQNLGLDTRLIKPTTFKDFSKSRPEPRPKHEWLDIKKFEKSFGKGILKTVEQGINEFSAQYRKTNLL